MLDSAGRKHNDVVEEAADAGTVEELDEQNYAAAEADEVGKDQDNDRSGEIDSPEDAEQNDALVEKTNDLLDAESTVAGGDLDSGREALDKVEDDLENEENTLEKEMEDL